MKGLAALSLCFLILLISEIGFSDAKKKKNEKCLLTGAKAYDRCSRRCDIANGKLVRCCRVRRDFESMTPREQRRFIRAYLIISTRKPYKQKYRKLIKMHQKYFDTRIHRKEEFLPWHRWFNLQLENLLRLVDCRVTLPYWDWSIWSHDPWDKRKMWSPMNGLGGNGRKSDECVSTGPFRVGKWVTASDKCLKRAFNKNPPDADEVAIAIREPDFNKFELMVRVNLHEGMHCFINGTMCSMQAAEAPEFFLHHGFVDKIWSDFQKKGPNHKNAYFPSIKQKMTGIKYYPSDLLDNDKLPGGVRVCYDDPSVHSAKKIRKFLNALSFHELETLQRMSYAKTPGASKHLFHVSLHERKAAAILENEAMRGVDSKRISSVFAKTLSSLGRVEGFKVPNYCTLTPSDEKETDAAFENEDLQLKEYDENFEDEISRNAYPGKDPFAYPHGKDENTVPYADYSEEEVRYADDF